jgi:hypothetical protein
MNFKVQGNNLMSLKTTGLGLGTSSPSANLHVMGNAHFTEQLIIGGSNSSANLAMKGTYGVSYQTVTADTSLSAHSHYLADSSSDNLLLSLPTAASSQGRMITIKKISTNHRVVVQDSSANIDGSTNITLTSGHLGMVKLSSSGGNWHIIGRDQIVAWSPLQLSPLAWFDPSDETTITSSSTNVTRIEDKSGNGRFLHPGNQTNTSPQTGVRSIYGLNAIECVRDDYDYMEGSFVKPASGNIAMFIVADVDKTGNQHDAILGQGRGTNNGVSIKTNSMNPPVPKNGGSVGTAPAPTTKPFGPKLYYLEADLSKQFVSLYINGGNVSNLAYSTAYSSSDNLMVFNNSNGGTLTVDGAFGEIVVLENCPESDRQKMEGYLSRKWGLSLPHGHPYESSTP